MREFSQQLTLFTEGSLVNPSAWQETKKAKTMPVTCGRNFRAWSENLNRVGYLLKTYLEYCVSRLTMFAPIWNVKATASGYGILKLRLSVRNTDGNECFLWRTPDAHCNRGASSKERYKMKLEKGMPISLNDQVAHLLPTPTANDAKNNGSPSRYNRNSLPLDAIAGGSLNPEWVEILMGFPVGWTEI